MLASNGRLTDRTVQSSENGRSVRTCVRRQRSQLGVTELSATLSLSRNAAACLRVAIVLVACGLVALVVAWRIGGPPVGCATLFYREVRGYPTLLADEEHNADVLHLDEANAYRFPPAKGMLLDFGPLSSDVKSLISSGKTVVVEVSGVGVYQMELRSANSPCVINDRTMAPGEVVRDQDPFPGLVANRSYLVILGEERRDEDGRNQLHPIWVGFLNVVP